MEIATQPRQLQQFIKYFFSRQWRFAQLWQHNRDNYTTPTIYQKKKLKKKNVAWRGWGLPTKCLSPLFSPLTYPHLPSAKRAIFCFYYVLLYRKGTSMLPCVIPPFFFPSQSQPPFISTSHRGVFACLSTSFLSACVRYTVRVFAHFFFPSTSLSFINCMLFLFFFFVLFFLKHRREV